MRLKDKVAIVTGAGQGIGEAITRKFVAEGAFVAMVDVNEKNLVNLANELNKDGEKVLPFTLDVTNAEQVKGLVAKLVEKNKKIDIVVNNAGITRDNLVVKTSEADWDAVMNINLKAPFVMVKEVFPVMKEQKSGVILNASSVSSLGNVGQSNYAASKAGLIGLTKTWALEFARYNVRANVIGPGFTETPMVQTVPDKVKEKIVEKIPLRRFATPEEIANAYCFLASDEASFITGQVLFVDGGLTCGF
ncbi:MAG: beta-ketoacyl-ACP reductase [Candidatus Sericytochromatia bacterium]